MASLEEFLADPKKFVKKRGANTSMALKLNKSAQRADVIAYLKKLK